MDWIYNGQPLTTAPENAFGFVYLITNIQTGQRYIGKKQFWSHHSKKVVGKRNRKHTTKESDWKNYWSSSDEVKAAVAVHGNDSFVREILTICYSKRDLTYGEIEEQFRRDVLRATLPNGQREYLNKNIMNRFFIPPDVRTKETLAKLSSSQQARCNTEDGKAQLAAALTKSHSQEANIKRSCSMQSFLKSEDGKVAHKRAIEAAHKPDASIQAAATHRKVSPEGAIAIKERKLAGESTSVIAKDFGVSVVTVRNILNNKYGYCSSC